MAGYLRRLAQHSGMIAAARPRAEPGAEAPDIMEIHEERVIGGTPPAPAAQPGADRGASVYDGPTAPAPGGNAPGALDAAPASGGPVSPSRASAPSSPARAAFAPPAERSRLQAPPSAPTPDSPAARTPGVSGIERASIEHAPAARSLSAPAPAKGERAVPTTGAERAAAVAAVTAADASHARTPPGVPALPSQSPSSPARGSAVARSAPPRTDAPHAMQLEERDMRAPAAASEAKPGIAPRRFAVAAPAPTRHVEPPVPRAKENGVKVHIGKINVEIRAPAPRPAAPFVAAPAPAPVFAPAPAEAPFSSYRHYLRSGS